METDVSSPFLYRVYISHVFVFSLDPKFTGAAFTANGKFRLVRW